MTVFRNAALFMAIMLLASAAWAASIVPSIEITGINANEGGCATPGISADVILNTPATSPHSDNYEIYNGATLLYRWTGEVYTGVGPNFYGITEAPTAVPADTTITGIIYTFPTSTNPPAPYNASEYSYRSEVQWNCTTGALISITNSGGGPVASVVSVPALGPEALAALALLLLVAGAWLVRRRT